MTEWNRSPEWKEYFSHACDGRKLKLRDNLTSQEAERIIEHAAAIEATRVAGFTPDDQRRYKKLFEMDHDTMYWSRLNIKDEPGQDPYALEDDYDDESYP